ncbi:MAG: lipopolysaccharide transport periplasmic protein LptA [Gammaproteobacteria bacterium]
MIIRLNTKGCIFKTISNAILLSGLMAFTQAMALSTDQEQPIQIEADAAELDDKNGITVYSGNVVVIQGSMTLRGNRFTLLYNDDNTLKTATMLGQPASFKQTPDDKEKGDIDGKGVKIDYLASDNKLILTEDAELLQNGKLFKAYNIEYDTEESKMIARKAVTGEYKPSGKSAEKNTGRIKVILPPKKKN